MPTTAQINININASQADKTVQQLNKDLNSAGGSAASLKAQLRQVTQELQGLEPGSARFQELSQRAGELKDQIQDTSAVISATAGNVTENLGKALGNTIQLGVAGFQALQSAQVLFGVENEDLQKTLAQMGALLNLSQAIETFGGLGDKLTQIKAGFTPLLQQLGLMSTKQTQVAVATGAADAALVGEAVAADGAAVSTGIFATALNALPLVAIVTAIGLLVAGLISYASSSGDAEKAQKKLTKAEEDRLRKEGEAINKMNEEIGGFRVLIGALSKTVAGSKERSALIDEINGKYGTTLKNLSDEVAFQNQLNGAVINYIALSKARYVQESTEDRLKTLYKEEEALNAQLKQQNDLMQKEKERQMHTDDYMGSFGKINKMNQDRYNAITKALEENKKSQEASGKAFLDAYNKEKEALKDLGIVEKQNTVIKTNNTDATNAQNEALEKQRKLLDEIKTKYDRQSAAEKELKALLAARTVQEMSTFQILEDENGKVEEGLVNRLSYNEEYFKKRFDLEEQYNQKETTLIENATKREVELLDEKFLKGGMKQKDYEDQRKKITENGSKNLLEIEVKLLEELKKNNEKELNDYTKLWDNKEATAQEATRLTNAEIEKLTFDFNQKMLIDEVENSTKTEKEKNAAIIKIRTDGLEEQKRLIQKVGKEQVDVLKLQKEKELTNYTLTANEKAQISAKYDKQILETEQNTQSQIQDAIEGTVVVQETQISKLESNLTQIDKYLEAVQNAFSDFETTFTMFQQQQNDIRTQAFQDSLNERKASLESNLAAGLISQEEYNNSLKQLEDKQSQDELQLKRKSFRQNKALNIVGATIDGARAVLSTFANTPGELIIKSIAAALAGVFAATQIALIARQEFKAAVGGIVPGSGSGEVDSVPSRLAPGEAVINAKSTDAFLPILSMINQAAGGKSLMPDIPAVNQGQRFEPVFQSQTQTQPIRAYVVESDISQSQRRVNRIINSATF